MLISALLAGSSADLFKGVYGHENSQTEVFDDIDLKEFPPYIPVHPPTHVYCPDSDPPLETFWLPTFVFPEDHVSDSDIFDHKDIEEDDEHEVEDDEEEEDEDEDEEDKEL